MLQRDYPVQAHFKYVLWSLQGYSGTGLAHTQDLITKVEGDILHATLSL